MEKKRNKTKRNKNILPANKKCGTNIRMGPVLLLFNQLELNYLYMGSCATVCITALLQILCIYLLCKTHGDLTLAFQVGISSDWTFFIKHPTFDWDACWFDTKTNLYTTRFRLHDASPMIIMTKCPVNAINWQQHICAITQHQHLRKRTNKINIRPVRSMLVKLNTEPHYQNISNIKPSKLLNMIWDAHYSWDHTHLVSHLAGIAVAQIESVYILHSMKKDQTFTSLDSLLVTQV